MNLNLCADSSGNRIGECVVPAGQVNPLNLQASVGMEDVDPLFTPRPSALLESNQTNHFRRRRDTEKVVSTRVTTDANGIRHLTVTMVTLDL